MTLRLPTPIALPDLLGSIRALRRRPAPTPAPAPAQPHPLAGIDAEIRDLREGCIRYAGTATEPIIRLALAETRFERDRLMQIRSGVTPPITPALAQHACATRQLLEDLR